MSKANARTTLMFLGLLAALAIPAGCGGGSSDGGGGILPCADPSFTPAQVNGVYDVVERDVANDCGDPLEPDGNSVATLTLTGSTLLVELTDGPDLMLQVCGDSALIPAEEPSPDDGGTEVTHEYLIFFNTATGTFQGTGTWSWVSDTNPADTCNGSFTLTGTKR